MKNIKMRRLPHLIRRSRTELPVLFSESVRALNKDALAELEQVGKRSLCKNKYNAQGRYVDDIWFDSGIEAERYGELKLLAVSGKIKNLKVHVPFKIFVNDVLVSKYEADFVYEENGKKVVEDTKGYVTPLYKVNRALMLAVHGIKIKEVRR